jgi:Tol biopolymer transport system component
MAIKFYINRLLSLFFVFQFSLNFISAQDSTRYENEKHFKNVRQLTFGGDNAEAYWSFDGKKIVYQYTNKKDGVPCDQIYTIDVSGNNKQLISTGKGRTTCAYFLPGDSLIIYASTHLAADSCPPEPITERGKYIWPLYSSFEIFVADLKGNIVKQLTNNNFYDAEATVSPKGDKIVFTSDRSGDIELYTMNIDGSDVKQITNEIGYDGGAFFSPDGKQIVWRSTKFDSEEEKAVYRENLRNHIVSPMKMELYIANADGSNRRQLTDLGGANWAPFFHPSGQKVIFSSNHKNKRIPFNLYMINTDGTNLEQITYDTVFDSFAMFSPDGKKIVWCGNRANGGTRDTNIFVADWIEK